MPVAKKNLSVFDYLDYRRYLEDYFTTQRMTHERFSIRNFTLEAGLPVSNSSFFSKVIAGKRNLTLDLQYKIAKALKLNASEMQYFGVLVRHNQSKDAGSRNHLYQELSTYRKSKARVITQEGYDYYSHWQYSILRAFFGIHPKENHATAIGKKIFPQISAREVEDGIKLLLQLGLIGKTANGYALRDANIATERENKDYVGKLRILEMLKLAQEVFPHVPAEDREFNNMTVYISKKGYAAMKEKIRIFREELKSLVASDQGEDRIYTLGMQFFPNLVLPEWGPNSVPKKT